MAQRFLDLFSTPAVLAAQQLYYGAAHPAPGQGPADRLTEAEQAMIESRDSFYLATVNAEGWPYLQHRGGRPGFLRVLDEHTLGFADLSGNRQLLSTGNLATNDRVALILVDYPQRLRLKIAGHARVIDAREDPALAARLAPEALPKRTKVERYFLIEVVGFDWNCPQHLTPRYTLAEVEELAAPLRARLSELESKLALLTPAKGG
jgi:predicted pyridoxine 5'-phosphate oxidase superfamily flavin-nucleotide-binding protein